ncbi:SsgA family sporulation/cell division regulator [Streptomyces fuscichromogenes]|uniref:SsgA family sporulation/cell division regulator n=1 Tax=Streptomyces fuscichromogenes TaxID=1324013 RepID=UPI0037F75BA3
MDHLAAADEEFDALLDASSLGAPHVVAETGDIPATARRRMAQAVQQQRVSLGNPDDTAHPQPRNEDSSRPEPPAAADHDVRMMRGGLLYGTTGTGNTSVYNALYAWWHTAHPGTSRAIWNQPFAQRPRTGPSAAGSPRRTLRLAGALSDPTRTVRPRCCIDRGDGMLAPLKLLNTPPLSDWAVSALCVGGEVQSTPSSTITSAQALQLLLPDNEAGAQPTLRTLNLPWAGQQRRLWNLRHWMEPSLQPDQPSRVTPTGLLVYPMPFSFARLSIARFTTGAYTAVGCGLLVPKADDPPRHRYWIREGGTSDLEPRPAVGTGGMKLWRTLVDGVPELSAELPMLFHFDERESLALTSNLQTRLTYRVSDPYAVEARFWPDGQRETVWIFARDLLKNGLERRNGLGDVTVWPGTGMPGEPRVFVRLSSPQGSALLSTTDADLRVFLNAGSNLVAYGEEHSHLEPALNALETTIGELARPGRCD